MVNILYLQPKPSRPSDHATYPVLWKYPWLVATQLYGRVDVDEMMARSLELAETYDDLECFIPEIKRVLPLVFKMPPMEWITPEDHSAISIITGYAEVAAVGWFLDEGKENEEALLWAVICLAYSCYMNPRGNGEMAFYEIAGYALTSRKSPLLPILWALSYDVIAVPPPDHGSGQADIMAVMAHAVISIAGGFPAMTQSAMRSKYLQKYNENDLAASRKYYSLDPYQEVASFFKSSSRSRSPVYTQAEFDLVKKECDLVFLGY